MTSQQLRKILQQPTSLGLIRAAATSGTLRRIVPTPFFEHIAEVYARLERAAGGSPDMWWMKLAVLLHEESAEYLTTMLDRSGFSDVTRLILDVLGGFGSIWKVRNKRDLEEFVQKHRHHLPTLLLFELAHEGTATPSMYAAAELVGIASTFRCWVATLTTSEMNDIHADSVASLPHSSFDSPNPGWQN